MTAEILTDVIVEELESFSQLSFIVNKKGKIKKTGFLPGRTKIVEISVLAYTDKGGESMSRILKEECLQLHNAPKKILRGAAFFSAFYSTTSRHRWVSSHPPSTPSVIRAASCKLQRCSLSVLRRAALRSVTSYSVQLERGRPRLGPSVSDRRNTAPQWPRRDTRGRGRTDYARTGTRRASSTMFSSSSAVRSIFRP
ncbi:unnamed protein product [Pleuronectes platessa]|uniref:Uncharacterized protein n=1 Tax=Pleuronectes platessa TaxID=8262 RepID=A0A9N7V8C8_PLEPL|nr:unnamed protein product [Pleuronectes platessa]